jgi:hypothetical protein
MKEGLIFWNPRGDMKITKLLRISVNVAKIRTLYLLNKVCISVSHPQTIPRTGEMKC